LNGSTQRGVATDEEDRTGSIERLPCDTWDERAAECSGLPPSQPLHIIFTHIHTGRVV